ncbi:aminodeoxychorismate lyase [uncultured Corynebacterium sp.]|uniref:aminodeoxychorismate lyase n=1 Tax=uncultured Corynebacterium sp. TaxID=159447 RepID=UPI002626B477|nr:aminodeoxychorismate lyase [uncultured Corynebacterium sp.]
MTDSLSSLVLIDVFADGGPVAVEAAQPFLYADDLGAIRGDGVFETLLVRGGHTCNTDRHEKRFASSALMLDLPAPDLEQWRAATEVALQELRARSIEGDATLRWVYSRGRESTGKPTGYVLASSAAKVAENRLNPVSVMLAERGFSLDLGSRAPWALIGAKTLSYAANMAALRYAKSKGFDDVIFTSAEGNLLEGPTSTIIVQRGNELLTPNPGEGVLPGTTQAALFETAANCGWTVTPTVLVPGDLYTADAVWLVSSVRIAVVVKSIDGEPIRQPDAAAEKEFRDLCDEALATQ